MGSEERVIKTEKVYEGRVVTLRCDTVELPGQKYAKREIVDHAGGVTIVALTEDNKIPFVKQFRIATGKHLLELPAGLIDHNENPKQAALRELEEETGWLAEEVKFLVEFYTSPGFTNEKVHIFKAENLKKTQVNFDDTENIEIIELTMEEALHKIKLGEIIDAKTIVGLLYVEMESRK